MSATTGVNRTVQFQQMTDKKQVWTTIQSKTLNGKVTFTAGTYNTVGWVKYRIHMPATGNIKAYTTTELGYKIIRSTPKPAWTNIKTNLNSLGTSGFNGTIEFRGDISIKGSKVVIERSINNGTWATIQTTTATSNFSNIYVNASDKIQNVDKGTVRYRARLIAGNNNVNNSTSTIQTVNYNRVATTVSNSTLNGKTFSVANANDSYRLGGTINNNGQDIREVWVQKYNPTTKQYPIVAKQHIVGGYFFDMKRSWGAGQFRIHIPAVNQKKSYTGPLTQINRPLEVAKMSATKLKFAQKITPWTQNTISTTLNNGNMKTTMLLQKRNGTTGNSWKTLETRTNVSSGKVTFNLPKGTTATVGGNAEYRIYANPTTYSKAAGTAYMKTQWENPHHYSGMKKTAFQFIKMNCPNTLINIGDLPGAAVGTAFLSEFPYIVLEPRAEGVNLRTISNHECAHIRQWDLYGSNGYGNSYSTLVSRLATLHGVKGSLGIEQNADCIANAWYKVTYWAYKGNCSGERGTAAKLMSQNKKW